MLSRVVGAHETFLAEVRLRLAAAFVAAYGVERGQEALAEALAYAWEHRERLAAMENPAGYLYRVGQSRSRGRRTPPVLPLPIDAGLPDIEPRLVPALLALSDKQRVCVALVVAHHWSMAEAAELLGISKGSVQVHVERGLVKLRSALGVTL